MRVGINLGHAASRVRKEGECLPALPARQLPRQYEEAAPLHGVNVRQQAGTLFQEGARVGPTTGGERFRELQESASVLVAERFQDVWRDGQAVRSEIV